MNKDKKLALSEAEGLIPELRFSEFRNEGEWDIKPLGNLSNEIFEKTQGRKFKLMSITSGIGLVSQFEKFGREIAGNSYVNYLVIRNGDFAYNKSSTKLYSEGEIALYEDEKVGAVPNSIFTCFRFNPEKIYPRFAKYPFVNNLHGKWLRKFIAVGARANGALQVNSKDLFSIPFPYPKISEQQKIASCLSSLDEVIAAHSQKLELLEDHKKGLMQNLFPQGGENVPTFRFKEFENDGVWELPKLEDKMDIFRGASPRPQGDPKYYGGKVPRLMIEDVTRDGKYSTPKIDSLTEEGAAKSRFLKKGSVVLSCSGTRVAIPGILAVDACIHDGWLGFKNFKKVDTEFLYYHFCNLHEKIQGDALAGGVFNNLTTTILKEMKLGFPRLKEQQKIVSCLSSLDAIIAAQAEKIEQLKLHKKGLMQGLFPKINE